MNLANWLRDELARVRVKKEDEPTEELREGDTVVGTLPEDLRPFFALMMRSAITTKSEVDELRAQHRAAKLTSELAEISAKANQVSQLHEVVKMTFWNSVRATFPKIAGEPSIAIMKNWQVVICNCQPSATLMLIGAGNFVF